MKQCVIVSSMPVSASLLQHIEKDAFIIAADAGWKQVEKLGLSANLIVGDFDSSPVPSKGNIMQLPTEKDDTDTLFAARKAVELGYNSVLILGGLGGRLDHSFANMQTLLFLAKQGVQARLQDETTSIDCCGTGTFKFHNKKGSIFSLFAAEEMAEGITLQGLKYSLQNADVSAYFPIGVSNEFAEETASVTIENGFVYIMQIDAMQGG